nr:TIGR00341 family protein [uncultured Desulfuromonas sp.]
MKYIEIIAEHTSAKNIATISEKVKAEDFRLGGIGDDGMQQMRMLVSNDNVQLALDTLQNILGAQATAHIVVLSIEAMLPRQVEEDADKEDSAISAREVLYEDVERGAQLDSNFYILVTLSTIVASIGLIEDNVAVVIGAMVIAPLLGPNLALSLGTALGDVRLIRKSALTLFVGLTLSTLLSIFLAYIIPMETSSKELLSRTTASFDSILLALASGAAAALSLTTGLSGVLVGVMVAVALLPPAATLGIMLAKGHIMQAAGAGLLLLVNVVCVNLASKLVFFFKGIRPRTWFEQEQAKKSMLRYTIAWVATLLILLLLIFTRIYQ